MATHSSVPAWRIPGTGEPAGLPSIGSHRVGHDWSDLAAAAAGCLMRTKHRFWGQTLWITLHIIISLGVSHGLISQYTLKAQPTSPGDNFVNYRNRYGDAPPRSPDKQIGAPRCREHVQPMAPAFSPLLFGPGVLPCQLSAQWEQSLLVSRPPGELSLYPSMPPSIPFTLPCRFYFLLSVHKWWSPKFCLRVWICPNWNNHALPKNLF